MHLDAFHEPVLRCNDDDARRPVSPSESPPPPPPPPASPPPPPSQCGLVVLVRRCLPIQGVRASAWAYTLLKCKNSVCKGCGCARTTQAARTAAAWAEQYPCSCVNLREQKAGTPCACYGMHGQLV